MSPTPDVGCLICSEPPESETQHECHLLFGEKTYKAVLTKIFQYLLLPTQDVPMLYWMCRDERFCSRCLEVVEEIEEYQSKIQALELALQHKVEALGKVIATSKKYNAKDYERRNLRNASEKATELWTKFRSPILQSFKEGMLPSTPAEVPISSTSVSVSSSSRSLPKPKSARQSSSRARKEEFVYEPTIAPSPSPSFESAPNNDESMDGCDDEDFDNDNSQSMGDFVDPESDEDYQPTKTKRTKRRGRSNAVELVEPDPNNPNSSLHTSTGRAITAEQAALIRPFDCTEEVIAKTPGLLVFPSVRGKFTLSYKNYVYLYRGVEKSCISYRCCQHNYGCKARIRISYDYTTILYEKDAEPEKHNHEADPVSCEKRYAMWRMRKEALQSKDSDVNNIVEARIKALPPECIDALPQLESMRRCVKRLKHKIHGKPPTRPPRYKQRKPKVPSRKACISALLSQPPPTATATVTSGSVHSSTDSYMNPMVHHLEPLQYHNMLL